MALCLAGLFGLAALRRRTQNRHASLLLQPRRLGPGMGRADAHSGCGTTLPNPLRSAFRSASGGSVFGSMRQPQPAFPTNPIFVAWCTPPELPPGNDAPAL